MRDKLKTLTELKSRLPKLPRKRDLRFAPSSVQGWASTELCRSQAAVIYREPLAIPRRFVSYGGTSAEDGVASAFPTCWVVAESEAQRVNKMKKFPNTTTRQ